MNAATELTEYNAVRYAMRNAWLAAFGTEPAGWTGGEEVDDPEVGRGEAREKARKKVPFDVACYRILGWIDSFPPPYSVSDIAIVCHGQHWRVARDHWQNPPGKIVVVGETDAHSRRCFWVMDRDEALAEGDLDGDL